MASVANVIGSDLAERRSPMSITAASLAHSWTNEDTRIVGNLRQERGEEGGPEVSLVREEM